jgi:dTDP-4-amino-4,6-dideoxygalactose transaminase
MHFNQAFSTLTLRDVFAALFPGDRGQAEAWFCQNVGGVSFGFNSGRVSLWAILRAMDIKKGDEVVISGFTCSAVPEAVIYAGGRPVYADIDINEWSFGLPELRKCCTQQTRVIIIQHSFGRSHDLNQIIEFARSKDIFVIEDCALALGNRHQGKALGSFGDAAFFSFEMTKTVTSGWGGVAVLHDVSLIKIMKELHEAQRVLPFHTQLHDFFQILLSTILFHPRIFGRVKYIVAAAYRFRFFKMSGEAIESSRPLNWAAKLSNYRSQLVARQLLRLDDILLARKTLLSYYCLGFEERGWDQNCLDFSDDSLPLRIPVMLRTPVKVMDALSKSGFEVGRWFKTPVDPMPDDPESVFFDSGTCLNSAWKGEYVINLPMHIGMSKHDVDALLDTVQRHGGPPLPCVELDAEVDV